MGVDSAHLILSSAVVLVVLGVAIAANWRRAGFLDALLAAGGDAVAIEAVLGRYVAEPTLRLRFCTEEGWMDAAGRPVAHASPSAGRVFRPIVVEPAGPAVVADLEAAAELLTALARRHGVSILASGSAEGTTVSALHSATSPAPGDRGKGESAHV